MQKEKRFFVWIGICAATSLEMALLILVSVFRMKFWKRLFKKKSKKVSLISSPSTTLPTQSFLTTYILNVENKSEEDKEATLFGGFINLTALNFGNPEGIEVTSASSYLEVLMESIHKPFIISGLRISSSSGGQIDEVITVSKANADGARASYPIQVSNYLSAFQFQSNIRDIIPYSISFDGSTSMSVKVLAGARFSLFLFVEKQFDPIRELRGIRHEIENVFPSPPNPAGSRIVGSAPSRPFEIAPIPSRGLWQDFKDVWKEKVAWKKMKWLGDTSEVMKNRNVSNVDGERFF